MASANVKLGVEYQQFKQGMRESEAAVKTLSEALKLNEKQLQNTGNEELVMKNRSELLAKQIEKQRDVVQQANAALDEMKKNGVEKSSVAFQNLQRKVYEAEGKLEDMKGELANVGKAGETTSESLGKIEKAVSWQNVADGIGKVTDKLEAGARAAVRFGKRIMQSAMESTQWADDILTKSVQYGIDPETLQRMEYAADFVDTDVDTIIQAKDKLAKSRGNLGDLLGITTDGKSNEDLFWETGEAIKNLGDGYDQAEIAQKVFGRSWRELLPLFTTGREEYESMLQSQNVLTNEQVQSLGKADDSFKQIQHEIENMKNAFWAENADKITSMLQWLIDNKDDVLTALKVIAGGFGLLKMGEFAANLMQAVNGFKTLGVIKGGSTAAAAGASGGFWSRAQSAAGFGGIGGLAGMTAILAGFGWARDQRNNNAAAVRGTDENLAAQSAGAESLLVQYIQAEARRSELMLTGTAEEFQAAQQLVTDLHAQLMGTQGGANALDAYSAWRQENSYGNDYWQVPEYLDRVARVTESTSMNEVQSNSEVTAALGNLEGLPAAMSAAVQAGMANVTIVVSEGAIGAIGRRTAQTLGNAVQAALRG